MPVAEVRTPRLRPLAREGALVAGLAALLLACAASNADHGGYVDALAVVVAVIACAPVVLRTCFPMAALGGTVAGAFVALATFKPMATVIVPIGLVLYSIAVCGSRRRTLAVAGAAVLLTLVAMAIFSEHELFSMAVFEKLGLVLLPLIAGVAMREHKAVLEERAVRAERAARRREEDALRRIEQERLRIAREVHDVVAHSMVAINVQAGVAAHLMDRRPEAARDALHDIKRVSGDALRDLRATLGVLRSGDERAPVRPAPGLAAVGDLAERLRAAGIDVAVDVRGGGRPIPQALEGAGFRIVQEALTNVLRHSGARAARVAIAVGPDGLDIEVEDDGPGGDREADAPALADGSGNGLRGMRERAAAVGGRLDAGPRAEGGWRVHARLPLQVVPA